MLDGSSVAVLNRNLTYALVPRQCIPYGTRILLVEAVLTWNVSNTTFEITLK